jgi:hypothetical protein
MGARHQEDRREDRLVPFQLFKNSRLAMYYTDVLLRDKDDTLQPTAYRTPLASIYYDACLNTGKGKRYIKGRLKGHLAARHDKLERH